MSHVLGVRVWIKLVVRRLSPVTWVHGARGSPLAEAPTLFDPTFLSIS